MPPVKKVKPAKASKVQSNNNDATPVVSAQLDNAMPPVKKVKTPKASKAQINDNDATPVISAQIDKKIQKQKQKVDNQRGVVFIKHLPHGFFEEQLKKYFQQFGNVTQLRLVRSKRTGGSKGFAFVEFEYPEVAQVAAETMDNYLMFKRVVKASYIPPNQQRFNYFKTTLRKVKNKAGKDIYVSAKSTAKQRKVKQQNDWSDDAYQKRTEMKLKKIKGLKKKYAHLGIDFSDIVVMPKQVNPDEKTEKSASKPNDIAKIETKKKRKITVDTTVAPPQSLKKRKNVVGLEDLLGSTINEDSEDEDWHGSDDDLTSDEETYGFQKDSDGGEENDGEESEDDNNDTLVKSKVPSKSNLKKPAQPSKIDRFDKLIKRKPQLGGIQKPNKKAAKKPITSKAKKLLQVSAFKELKPKKGIKKQKQA